MKSERSESTAARPVGIWIRVSTEDQAQGESPEHHERRARLYSEAREWNVVRVYHLEGVSGKSVWDHPECKRMKSDAQKGRIQGLIFSKLARLARNTRELLDFADFFKECGCDLISLQEAIDTSTPAGRLFYTLIAAMAQWEREETVERVNASVAIRAKLGSSLGGPAPFGYRWQDRRLAPDPAEAPVRKLMYDLFLLHQRKKTVVGLLNDGGHRTRKGAKFTSKTLSRLLQDSSAKGVHRMNYTTRDGRNGGWSIKPKDKWHFHRIEPIVTEEVWDQCNRILDKTYQTQKRPARKRVHLFAGLAFCECGAKMYVPSNSPKYVCQNPECRNKIRAESLEGAFVTQIKDYGASADEIDEYLTRADEGIVEKEKLLGGLQTELQRSQQEMAKVLQLFKEGRLDSEGFSKFYDPLNERTKQIEDEIPRLQSEIDISKVGALSASEIASEAASLYQMWPTMEATTKRDIIEQMTEQVQICKDKIVIRLYYAPPCKDMAKRWRKGRDSNPR